MIFKSALLCLALNIHFEARGESTEGQIAVAHVTMNRARYNHTDICHEVFKKGQFSWTRKKFKIPSGEEWEKSKLMAQKALVSNDSVNGALFFFNPKKCHPKSVVSGRRGVKVIGDHVFYANINK